MKVNVNLYTQHEKDGLIICLDQKTQRANACQSIFGQSRSSSRVPYGNPLKPDSKPT